MKLGKEKFELKWGQRFQEILALSKEDGGPILIGRTDEPSRLLAIRKYLRGLSNSFYFKLGIANSTDKIYGELFRRYNCDLKNLSKMHNQTVKVVADKICECDEIQIIIVDNYHLIGHKCNLAIFIGLILEIRGNAQFVFLLPQGCEDLKVKANVRSKTLKNLLAKCIQRRYELN